MRKILSFLFIFLFATLLVPMVMAERYEDNFFKTIEITNSGDLVNAQSIDDVNVMGFVCSSLNCATVSDTLWDGNILNSNTDTPTDFLQLVYPTTLQSSYGYGIYVYKEGYIPFEVAADYWGTSHHDPVGPYDNYLAQKQLCRSDILYFDVDYDSNTNEVVVDFEIASPITHAGLLDYVPPSLISHYSANAEVNLEVLKDGEFYHYDYQDFNIEYSGEDSGTFYFDLEGVGEYDIILYTTLDTEDKCLDYLADEDIETIIVEEEPECTEDTDCPDDYYTDTYCIGDDLYEDFHDFYCSVLDECEEDITQIFLEECDYGCAGGECQDECTEDTDCPDDYYTDTYCIGDDLYEDFHDFYCSVFDECEEYITQIFLDHCDYGCAGGECQDQCTVNEDCGLDFFGPNYCIGTGVFHDFHSFECISGNCNEIITPVSVEPCSYECFNGECIGECTEDNDCPDDYYTDTYCIGDDLYEDFYDFYCSVLDECEEDVTKIFLKHCDYGCAGGECIDDPVCFVNSDCGIDECFGNDNYCFENDVYQEFIFFVCNNPGQPSAFCSNYLDPVLLEDCGTDYCEDWNNFCQGNDLYHSRTCYDKGCAIGQCFSTPYPEEELVETCTFGCSEGNCLPEEPECTQDSDCDDDYYSEPYCTLDNLYEDFHEFSCESEECEETITPILIDNCTYGCALGECLQQCTEDTDCPDDFYSDNYCIDDEVFKDFHEFSCEVDICTESTSPNLVETCTFGCSEGNCLPEEPECTQDSDCDNDFFSDNYCSNDDVYKDFHNFSCEAGICVENTSQNLVEECDDECDNGDCEEENNNGGRRRGGGYYEQEDEDSQVLGEASGTRDYSFLTSSISETQHLGNSGGAVQQKTTSGFSMPLWLIILLVVLIVVFLILIIIASLAR